MANLGLTYQEKQEIKELSRMFFGSSSRWQKLVEKGGVVHQIGDDGKPVVSENGAAMLRVNRQDAQGLLQALRSAKVKWDAEQERRRREQETMRAAQLASGSVGES